MYVCVYIYIYMYHAFGPLQLATSRDEEAVLPAVDVYVHVDVYMHMYM